MRRKLAGRETQHEHDDDTAMVGFNPVSKLLVNSMHVYFFRAHLVDLRSACVRVLKRLSKRAEQWSFAGTI